MGESIRTTDDSIKQTVTRYADTLVRVCFSYLKSLHDAEDIAQDTFLKLIEKQPVFESAEHQKAWLLRVAINLSKNRLKTTWFRNTEDLCENEIPFTPEESNVMNAVRQLPVKYRSVIHLYYIEGYSISEIGSLLKRNEATVASHLYRARKQFETKTEGGF
jgi:RNA polymerase sigma-70 factor (ECF subfamily)